ENEDPGFIYHSIGINGASFTSFLRCNLLEKQLKALNPDMIIISLGTNDAYTTKFKPEFYKANYEEMIRKIKKVAPNAAILNTVANDSYLFRRYPNKNTQLAADVIYQVAKKHNCGVYDFYDVMGGLNSSSVWYKENLMVKDKIHFNREGYLLNGDLLFNAFIKAYDNHLVKLNKKQ
ncbi:MAG: GDSL-type esterase/lipase family protein, partial [Bacteroidales bacterium]|nr:GDSL-type esterase/lipase family protein [Bacteroidales bacterium]